MSNNTATSVHRPSLFWKIVQFPLTRIVLGTLFVGISVTAALLLIAFLKQVFALSSPLPLPFDLLEIILTVLAAYLAYLTYVHLVEQRPVAELARQGAVEGLGSGLFLGFGLVTLVIGILWLLDDYHVVGINAWPVLIAVLVADLPSAFIQQLFLLGILFRITEQAVGTWWALLITVMVFGLVHLITIPHITVMDTLGILLAGLLFATTYLLTRTLWLPIALHTAWSVTIDGVFGVGVAGTSGVALRGVLQAHLTSPVLLTGGASGAQASLVTIVVILVVSAFLVVRAKRRINLRLSTRLADPKTLM